MPGRMSLLAGVVCPKGHRIRREVDGRLWCQECRRPYYDRQLVPKPDKLRKRELGPFARGYSEGYEAGCTDTLAIVNKELG